MAGLRQGVFLFWLIAVAAVALASPTVAGAAFPGRNGRIGYVDERTTGSRVSDSEIVSVLPDGSRPRTLLGFDRVGVGGAGFADPAYSPDGRKLAVDDFRNGETEGSSLYLVRADGRGRLRRLTPWRQHRYDGSPSWARDGRRLVYVRSGRRRNQIRVYHAGKSRPIRGIASGSVGEPVWSVGGQIALTRSSVIYLKRPGSRRSRVANGRRPDWSPAGRWIVYELSYPQRGIAMVRPDGSHQRVLTNRGAMPAFSPDGKYIVYVDDVGYRALIVMRLRDRQTRTIVTVPPDRLVDGLDESRALYSPDWQPLPRRRHR